MRTTRVKPKSEETKFSHTIEKNKGNKNLTKKHHVQVKH